MADSRLKRARERAGLTQLELANMARVVPGVVMRIEQGRGQPSWEVGLRLARMLGVSSLDEAAKLFATDGET